jgi:hypothetical protein
MPKITVAESLQVFLSILTDTVLDQIMDREHFPLASAFASGTPPVVLPVPRDSE